MFATDTKQLQGILFFASMIVFAPAQIAVAIVLIYQQVAEATFVGVGFMIAIAPLNVVIFILIQGIRKQMLLVNDQRVKLMNEVLAGIRILKYYAWEGPFSEKVLNVREDELILLRKLAYVVAIGFSLILLSVPIVQPILIFFTYVRLGNQLDAAKAFTTLSLFNLIRFPFAFLPMGLAQYAQAKVSMQRILDFLCIEELPNYVIKDAPKDDPDCAILLDHLHAAWTNELPVEDDDNADNSESKIDKLSESNDKSSIAVVDSSVKKEGGKDTNDAVGVKDVELVDVAAANALETTKEKGVNRSLETLVDINMQVKRGSLVAVVGPVGCGKSSLLNCMIGELLYQSGRIHVNGNIAYCDQKVWIMNATVKDNILFGRDFDETRFDMAIHAACLEADLKVLPGGVNTEIGERGINLSGGQKARVALARAVYRNADIYLLDDPMSAMDSHVGAHIFEQCIKSTLKDKTRILVTHHLHLLTQCDQVLILEDGKMKAFGTPDELVNSGVDLELYLPDLKKSKSTESLEEAVITATKQEDKKVEDAEDRKKDNRESKLTGAEDRAFGEVHLSTYWYYIKSGSVWLFLAVVLAMTAGKAVEVSSAFYLSDWSKASVEAEREGDPLDGEENISYVNHYAMLACMGIVGVVIRSLFLANHRLQASRTIHNQLLTSVIACPIAFFDSTPLGRVLNRFSSDIQTIDEDLSANISQLFNAGFEVLKSVGGIAAATKGIFLAVLTPLAFVYYRAQKFFRKSSTELQRLESISKSPIYANFSETLNGIATVRAFGDEEIFIRELEKNANNNTVANVLLLIGFQWLSLRLDLIGSITSLFIAALAVGTKDMIPAGYIALGLSYSFDMSGYLKYAVRMIAQVEANMNSVERVSHYAFDLDAEMDTLDPKAILNKNKKGDDGDDNSSSSSLMPVLPPPINEPPKDWPTKGEITADSVFMSYSDGPDVLKGLDFTVAGVEKVGIAGRTGSGKSSLMVALFRIENFRGSIKIDGIDTKTVPLNILRSKLGIIPQDPVMFAATVRFNLDPLNAHTDEEIWAVLDKVGMKKVIQSLPEMLKDKVSEGGDNFSAGQRQLICIARALLRNPKILVLDEATASIDNETDSMVQAMIRSSFKDSTVLTIAHRLHTIIDADKIIVMDSGKVAEMDTPSNLLKIDDGIFKGLWHKNQTAHGDRKSVV